MRMKMMLQLLLLSLYLLHLGGIQADNVIHYDNSLSPNLTAYGQLITSLRAELTSGYRSHGIPVLRQSAAEASSRFILIELESGFRDIITVAIDVVNVQMIGYLGPRNTFYYFTNTPHEDIFPGAQRHPLGYSNNYKDLGNRANVKLGHAALDSAILALSHDFAKSQRESLMVIMQMLSEAARIKYIEHLIRRNMISNSDFLPDYTALSLEDSWSNLSEQIQRSGTTGAFLSTIQVRNLANSVVQINNIQAVVRGTALALLLYHCHDVDTRSNNLIRMSVAVGDVDEAKWCPLVEATTNIVGREELCADVRTESHKDGTPVQLYPCGSNTKRNQQWTFQSDNTIRSMGKCLTTNGYKDGGYVMIYDCGLAISESTKWELTNTGTIINPHSQLVLTASKSKSETNLTVSVNSNTTSQAWTAGYYTQPVVTYISGYGEKCLQANDDNTRVWVADCVIRSRPKQQWTLYSDSTIRLYNDRTLCVTSNGHNIRNVIILSKCKAQGNQRWSFRADGTILNPNSGLVMDVKESDVSLQKIILDTPTGNPNQQWLAFF